MEATGIIFDGDHQPQVDLSFFRTRLPAPTKMRGAIINTVADVLQVDFVRSQVSTAGWKSVPSDIFLWAQGKPAQPYWTKVGGSPYRKTGSSWPELNGQRMSFLCQWDFADSRDIISTQGKGDVLLLFVASTCDIRRSLATPEELHFEWATIGPGAAESPNLSPVVYPHLYGCRLRYSEYPSEQLPESRIFRNYLIPTTQATRIGGATWYIQNRHPAINEKLLCTFSSLQPKPMQAYPYLNHPAPLARQDARAESLLIGDVGCIYVFIDEHGSLRWQCDCY